jgi:hypothetical protein
MTEDATTHHLPATPVHFRFVSVHRIVGFSGLRTGRELSAVTDLPLQLGVEGVTARLTTDFSESLLEVDRGAAVAKLMLLGFAGNRSPGSKIEAVEEHARAHANERVKKLGPSGVYLVVEVRGNLVTTPTDVARDLGAVVFAFDAVDKKELKARHEPLVSTALTAIALAVDTTTNVSLVADGVALTLSDGRPLYSLTFTAGNLSATVARPASDKDVGAIEHAIAVQLQDERLRSPSRLLVDALRSTDDRLEAFILAWAALEMMIRKYTAGCETGDWIQRVNENDRPLAMALHRDYEEGGHQHYSLAAKVRVFALKHNLGAGEDLATETTRIRKAFREPLYHEGAIADRQFPVEAVIALLRKVMDAAMNPRAVPRRVHRPCRRNP